MHIDLTFDELSTLKTGLDRALSVMENELIHTDAPSLQHALASDVSRLRSVRDLIVEQSMPTVSRARPSYDDRTL
jgi:hypothetical protein